MYGVYLSDADLTPALKTKVIEMSKWKEVFSHEPTDLCNTDVTKYQMNLTDTKPFKEIYSRIPPALIEEVREHVAEILQTVAIRQPRSPFSSSHSVRKMVALDSAG